MYGSPSFRWWYFFLVQFFIRKRFITWNSALARRIIVE